MNIFLGGNFYINENDNIENISWGHSQKYMVGTDVCSINIDGPITYNTYPIPINNPQKISPKCIKNLVCGNINYINLANSHIFDYNLDGFQDTIKYLDNNNIKHCGAGNNKKEAKKEAVFIINGMKILILSASNYSLEWKATKKNAGIWYIDPKNKNKSKFKYIKKVIKKHKPDIVLFHFYWKETHINYIPYYIKSFFEKLIVCGINIIQMHGLKHISSYELLQYKQKSGIVFYSLGNLLHNYPEEHYQVEYKCIDNTYNFGIYLNITDYSEITFKIIPFITTNYNVSECNNNEREEIKYLIKIN